VAILDWIVSFLSRLARQSVEPLVYFYAHWFSKDPEATTPESLLARRRLLMRSAPAWALMLVVLGSGFAASMTSSSLQKRYRKRLEEGQLSEGQLVRIGQRILADKSPFDAEDRFELARRLADLNSANVAAESDGIVEQLAPEDAQGYAPAHRARALASASILSRRPIDNQALRALGWHLQQSISLDDQPLQRVRSEYYLATGQSELAYNELSKLAQTAPEYWFALSEVLLARGDLSAARNALSRAAQVYEKQVSQNPADAEPRIRYATAMGRLGEFDLAIESMKTGWKLTKDPRFPQGICDVYLMKFQKQRNLQGPVDQQWSNIEQAIEWNPDSQLIFEALSQLCADPKSQAIQEVLNQKIDQLLSDSKHIPELMFARSNLLLGASGINSASISPGQVDPAIELLQEITEKYPDFHPALNNLAWLMVSRPEATSADAQQAYRYAQRAVELLPNSASYRDTLGLILTKQQRWTEAIAQYEISLRSSQNPIPTLEKIAQAYQNIGQADLAQQYQKRIDQIQATRPSGNPNQGAGVK